MRTRPTVRAEGDGDVPPERVVAVAVEEESEIGEGGGAVEREGVGVLRLTRVKRETKTNALSLKSEMPMSEGSASTTGTICRMKWREVGASWRSSSTISTWEWPLSSKRKRRIEL